MRTAGWQPDDGARARPCEHWPYCRRRPWGVGLDAPVERVAAGETEFVRDAAVDLGVGWRELLRFDPLALAVVRAAQVEHEQLQRRGLLRVG